jgi:hypothetical protein
VAVAGGIVGAIVGFLVGLVIHVVFWNNEGWADIIPFGLAMAGILAGAALGQVLHAASCSSRLRAGKRPSAHASGLIDADEHYLVPAP